MASVDTNSFRAGMKLEIDQQPYLIVNTEFVKPGKGQAFCRVKLKNLISGRVIERTYKSNEKENIADITEATLRMLYRDGAAVVFMDDNSYEQTSIPMENIGDTERWLKEDILYNVVFYKDAVISVMPPTFMELTITQSDPGARGDTASGRVMKPAKLETGTEVQVPIFVNEGEIIKVDTRTGEYVSRA